MNITWVQKVFCIDANKYFLDGWWCSERGW